VLVLAGALLAQPASAESPAQGGPDTVENGGGRGNNSGAGGN